MELKHSGSGELTIVGNIKSIEDSNAIKKAVDAIVQGGHRRVVLKITSSFSMTSSVIGHLMKVVHHDGVQLSVIIEDQRLYTLLDTLNLIQLFNVTIGGGNPGRQ